jgi:hypothetical protein
MPSSAAAAQSQALSVRITGACSKKIHNAHEVSVFGQQVLPRLGYDRIQTKIF